MANTNRPPGRPKGTPKTGGRPKGGLNKATVEVREMAGKMLTDPDYQRNLQSRLNSGDAGPMEVLLWHYWKGKPKEQVEHQGQIGVAFTLNLDARDRDV